MKKNGFTLVELVIVIAVIAILAGVLIGTFAGVITRANDSVYLQERKEIQIQDSIEILYDNGDKYITLDELENAFIEALSDNKYINHVGNNDDEDIANKADVMMTELSNDGYDFEISSNIIRKMTNKLFSGNITNTQALKVLTIVLNDSYEEEIGQDLLKELPQIGITKELFKSNVQSVLAKHSISYSTVDSEIDKCFNEYSSKGFPNDLLNDYITDIEAILRHNISIVLKTDNDSYYVGDIITITQPTDLSKYNITYSDSGYELNNKLHLEYDDKIYATNPGTLTITLTDKTDSSITTSTSVSISLKMNGDNPYIAKNVDKNNYYDTLSSAINAAEAGNKILLLKDFETTLAIDISKSITLIGLNHTISSNLNSNIQGTIKITTNDVTVQYLNISGKKDSDDNANGLYIGSSNQINDIKLENVNIYNFQTSHTDAGLCISNAIVDIVDSNINDNNSKNNTGGGLHISNSTVILSNVVVEKNTTSSQGGGIYCINSTLCIYNSSINNNYSTKTTGKAGGAICFNQSNIKLEKVSFNNNNAETSNGKEIAGTEVSHLIFSETTFSNNSTVTNFNFDNDVELNKTKPVNYNNITSTTSNNELFFNSFTDDTDYFAN